MDAATKQNLIETAGRVFKRVGRTRTREQAIAEMAKQQGISKQAARCLFGAVTAASGADRPNFSARANPDVWLMLYELIVGGYAPSAWGVLQKALHAAYAQFTEGGTNSNGN